MTAPKIIIFISEEHLNGIYSACSTIQSLNTKILRPDDDYTPNTKIKSSWKRAIKSG